jgi:tRNA(His) 5'-end guanylyltransferase
MARSNNAHRVDPTKELDRFQSRIPLQGGQDVVSIMVEYKKKQQAKLINILFQIMLWKYRSRQLHQQHD